MGKRRRTVEHDNPDRWVISYADFITLLFAFFTAMYAISQVDLGKLEKFEKSMRSAFKTKPSSSSNSIIEDIRPLNYDDLQLENELKSILDRFEKIDGVNITRDDRGVVVLLGDSVLFNTGSSEIKEEAKPILSAMTSVINKMHRDVIIEGHTDNVPVSNSKYSSNWELSTARASSVLMYFLNEHNLDPSRFSVAGYGEFKSIASNATPEGRMKNRRVEIILKHSSKEVLTFNDKNK